MGLKRSEKRQAWLAYSSAAVAGLSQVQESSDDDDEPDDLMSPDEICEVSEFIADRMLKAYLRRFGDDEDDDEEEEDEPRPRRRR